MKIANSSCYGLSASIFTQNTEKGKELALELECGGVFINTPAGSDPSIITGGTKESGYGREGYKDAFQETSNRKCIAVAKA